MKLRRSLLTLAVFALASSSVSAQTWTSAVTGGLWSVPSNWTPNVVPGPGDFATLDNASANRVVIYDADAPASVGNLTINQSSPFTNTLEFNRAATVGDPVTLGSTGGTAEIRLVPPTTGNMAVTIPSVTLNSGGRLTLGASNPTTPRNTTLTGTVINQGGTIFVTALDPATAQAVSRTITGGLSMTSGSVTLDVTGTLTDTRLQVNGATNVSGGDFNRIGTRPAQFNMAGATANFNPATFDPGIALGLFGNNVVAEIGTTGLATNFGQLNVRSFSPGSFVKTVTTGPNTTFSGTINIGNSVDGSSVTLRLGSDINQTLATGNPFGLADAPNPGTFAPIIDTNGFSLTTASTTTWTPPNTSPTRLANWSVINSGTAGQGRIRVASVNFSSANQVNVGPGATVELFNTGVTSNVGGNGLIDATSTLRFARTVTGAANHTINSNRNVGHVEVNGASNNHTLTLQNSDSWAVLGELRATQGIISVSNTNKFGTKMIFAGENAPVGNNVNAVFAQVTFNTGATSGTYSSNVPLDFAAIPAGHLARSRFLLAGAVGDASRLELSGPISFLTAGVGGSNYRVELSAQRADQLLDVSGPITGGGGVTTLFINGGNSGVGTVRLGNGGNNFPSAMTVVNGTLLVGHTNALGTGGFVNMTDGATPATGVTVRLLTDADGVTVLRSITLTNTVGSGTAELYVLGGNAAGTSAFNANINSFTNILNRNLAVTAASGGTVNFNGIIGANPDPVGVTNVSKIGPGRVIFNGNNTYEGPTAVTDGSLFINGNQTAATGNVTVNANALLGGRGTVGGVTLVNGTISPGVDNINTLTINNALTINNIYIADVSTGPNVSDRLTVNGDLNLGPSSVLELPVTNTYEPPVVGGPFYTIATYAGTLNGTFSVVNNLPASYFIDYGVLVPNSITIQPVPEPATVLAWCAAGAGVASWLRRRRRPTTPAECLT